MAQDAERTAGDMTPRTPPPAPTDRILESRALFGGRTEITISHDGVLYRMKITRQGKLILNK